MLPLRRRSQSAVKNVSSAGIGIPGPWSFTSLRRAEAAAPAALVAHHVQHHDPIRDLAEPEGAFGHRIPSTGSIRYCRVVWPQSNAADSLEELA